jgi:hypothetical protein
VTRAPPAPTGAPAPSAVAVAAGFGRAVAEVGASLIVGGNIAGQTRVLTTAITLETSWCSSRPPSTPPWRGARSPP